MIKKGANKLDKQMIYKDAQALNSDMVAFRRRIHEHPGTGFDIKETVEQVRQELETMGYTVQNCGKAGLTTTVGNGNGPVFLLRADMDGLPIKEETNLPFQSTNGKMHACGHDMHTTMLLGAAKLLKQYETELHGTVKLMFQPAEEIMAGAADMIEAGILTEPKVDAAMMIHIAPGLPLPVGTILTHAPGVIMASCDWLEIHIKGVSGHGSTPSSAIDPLPAMANLITALQEIQARELSVDNPIALTFGCVEGGTTSNVIMDHIVLKGTLRTRDEKVRTFVKKRVEEMTSGVTSLYRCEGEVVWGDNCPVFMNNADLSSKVSTYLEEYLPKNSLLDTKNLPSLGVIMASEDFGYISQEVPTILLNLAASDARVTTPYPVHHPKLVLDESCMASGVTAFVGMAMEYLKENSQSTID